MTISALAVARGQALVLAAEFLHLLFPRIPFGFGATLVRGETLENAGLPLATPGDQVRGIEAFAAPQGADGAGLITFWRKIRFSAESDREPQPDKRRKRPAAVLPGT